MKFSVLACIIFFILLFACHQPVSNNQLLQNKIDSLEHAVTNGYKPGFGEFMSGIQVHHAKLWFAGKNKNWKLAGFEMKEIQEALDGIKQYCADRSEIKVIGMIDASMDSLSIAIQHKNVVQFNSGYLLFTATCNNCHRETGHEFNVITIPANSPFSNQDFKAQ